MRFDGKPLVFPSNEHALMAQSRKTHSMEKHLVKLAKIATSSIFGALGLLSSSGDEIRYRMKSVRYRTFVLWGISIPNGFRDTVPSGAKNRPGKLNSMKKHWKTQRNFVSRDEISRTSVRWKTVRKTSEFSSRGAMNHFVPRHRNLWHRNFVHRNFDAR